MELFLQTAIAGLLLGGVYALISIGLSLIFGVVRIINFAHGELVMLGMFATYWLWRGFGLDPYLSILIVAPLMFGVGVLIQRTVLQPILSSSAIMKIFATVGLSLVLQNLALYLWGGNYRSVRVAYSTATIKIGGAAVSVPRLVAFAVALVLVAMLFVVLKRTMLGSALRAVAEDRDTAALLGLGVSSLYLVTFGIGAALAGIAGALLMPFTSATPTIGVGYTLIAFVVVVLGGMGNTLGALLGGLLIGVVETLAGTYIDPQLPHVVVFGLFIVVLLIRPRGLFGLGRGTEEVGLR